jgi:hypothetical protein
MSCASRHRPRRWFRIDPHRLGATEVLLNFTARRIVHRAAGWN